MEANSKKIVERILAYIRKKEPTIKLTEYYLLISPLVKEAFVEELKTDDMDKIEFYLNCKIVLDKSGGIKYGFIDKKKYFKLTNWSTLIKTKQSPKSQEKTQPT